ncbi:MAG: ABC transporter substrate-binding protein [Rhodospirillaceae bacterium]|jgi:NitT/TauT family transport system substrate-binding protein|nr:ABC transporter substrate-binding protein [Rhodospirillaceae bacterium]
MRIKGLLSSAAGAAFLAAGVAAPAMAETDTVRLAQQFGLLYVPLHVVLDQKLVEKHAAAMGLPGLKVKLFKISGGANINKALLAKTIDFGSHGVGPALKLWGKTKGRFKIAVSMADMPLKLITNDPNINKLEDYLTVKNHKISTPAAKVSIQAVTLQMAAARIWGEPSKLDHLVVSMKHPTALAAMLSGGQSVKSHFATLPYSYQELQSGKVHTVTTSYDILGGQHSVLVMSASGKFKAANPKTYAAVVAAFAESFEWINKNPVAAAKTFIRYTRSKMNPASVEALIKDKGEIEYSLLPKKTMEYAKFLHKIGDIPEAKSWKDYYWENNYNMNGS